MNAIIYVEAVITRDEVPTKAAKSKSRGGATKAKPAAKSRRKKVIDDDGQFMVCVACSILLADCVLTEQPEYPDSRRKADDGTATDEGA